MSRICPIRTYPCPLIRPVSDYPYSDSCQADRDGFIRWHRHRIFISAALGSQEVSLAPAEDGRWRVTYGPILLGALDEAHPERGLLRPPRTKRTGPVSTISLDNSVRR